MFRILAGIETLNITTLKDIQGEVNQKKDLLEIVGELSEHISKGKGMPTTDQKGKSNIKERSESQNLQRRIEELQARIRELE